MVENVKMSPLQVYDPLLELIQKDGINSVHGFFYAIYKMTDDIDASTTFELNPHVMLPAEKW